MMISVFIQVINILANALIVLVIVDSVVSFFLSPYHPIRSALDRILDPLLRPIRRVVPLVGMFDFSPLILIILIEILSYLLVAFLHAL
jgi:YggT family protein